MSVSLVEANKRESAARKHWRWGALALIVTAQFMVILDVAIVNVALPSIKSDLGFSQESLQWVVTAYAIFFGGALLLGGRLGDLLGRRRLFVSGLAVFGASSLLCGLAWSEASLIAFRSLQGLGGAMLAPAALALLMTTFAEGRERNTALGIYGAAAGSGAAVGVLLGGVLTSYLSWPWIFFINVPVALVAIALTPLLLRESRAENALRHFDVAGATSITAGLMLLVYALTRATTDGWASATTIGLLAASAVLVLSFIAIELRSKAPLLPLRIFRIRSLAAANVAMVIIGSATFAEFFLLTLYLQDVLHYTAIQTGVAFSGFAISVVVASNLAQAVVSRVRDPGHAHRRHRARRRSRWPGSRDCRSRATTSGTCSPPSCSAASVSASRSCRSRSRALRASSGADAGIASGLVNTSRQMGGAIGLAAMSAIAATSTANYADAHPGVGAASAAALDHGFQTTLYVLTGLLVVGAVIAGVWIKPQRAAQAQAPQAELDVLKEAA